MASTDFDSFLEKDGVMKWRSSTALASVLNTTMAARSALVSCWDIRMMQSLATASLDRRSRSSGNEDDMDPLMSSTKTISMAGLKNREFG
jgi:hypothetical protein